MSVTARASNSSCSQSCTKACKLTAQEVSKRSKICMCVCIHLFLWSYWCFRDNWVRFPSFICNHVEDGCRDSCLIMCCQRLWEKQKMLWKLWWNRVPHTGWHWLIVCQQCDQNLHPLHLPGVPPSLFSIPFFITEALASCLKFTE